MAVTCFCQHLITVPISASFLATLRLKHCKLINGRSCTLKLFQYMEVSQMVKLSVITLVHVSIGDCRPFCIAACTQLSLQIDSFTTLTHAAANSTSFTHTHLCTLTPESFPHRVPLNNAQTRYRGLQFEMNFRA